MIDWICARLRGELLPAGGAPSSEVIWPLAQREGVGALLYARYKADGWGGREWDDLGHRFAAAVRQSAAFEVFRSVEIGRLMQALAQAGVPGLLMKGAPLAHTHYPAPAMRPAVDTDLLVAGIEEAGRAGEVLSANGFEKRPGVEGGLASTQVIYTKKLGNVPLTLTIDLHWAISNRRRFAKAFRFEELWDRSRAMEPLFSGARALGDEDALLLSCVHRIAHQAEGSANRLIWLYDIRLLALGMDPVAWRSLVGRAERSGLVDFLWDGLLAARRAFPFAVPPEVERELERAQDRVLVPPHLATGLGQDMDDWGALSGWRERLQFVSEHALPPADFMRSRYGGGWMPALYLHRLVTGAVRRLMTAVRARARRG